MAELYDWNKIADLNNDSPPDGFPENMAPSALNNAMREVQAVVARHSGANNGTIESSGTISDANTTKNQYNIASGQGGTTLKAGQTYWFKAHATSLTGSAKLQVDSRQNKDLRGRRASGLIQGEIVAGRLYQVAYTGTEYVLVNSGYDTGGVELCVVGGTANAITLTPIVVAQKYDTGVQFRFYATADSTAVVTVNVSGLGAKELHIGGNQAGSGAVKNGQAYTIEYDGTHFNVVAVELGTASVRNTGTSEGDVPLLGASGKLPNSTYDQPTGIPSGGASGQVLKKTSATDYAVGWAAAVGGTAVTGMTLTELGSGSRNPATAAELDITVSDWTGYDAIMVAIADGNTVKYTSPMWPVANDFFAINNDLRFAAIVNASGAATYIEVNPETSTRVGVTIRNSAIVTAFNGDAIKVIGVNFTTTLS